MKQTQNIADISKNTRSKLVSKLKNQLANMDSTITGEITRLNSNKARPIHQVNDLAGKNVGKEYLNAPEHTGENEWAIQLGRLLQDVKQLQRRVLRTEQSARHRAA